MAATKHGEGSLRQALKRSLQNTPTDYTGSTALRSLAEYEQTLAQSFDRQTERDSSGIGTGSIKDDLKKRTSASSKFMNARAPSKSTMAAQRKSPTSRPTSLTSADAGLREVIDTSRESSHLSDVPNDLAAQIALREVRGPAGAFRGKYQGSLVSPIRGGQIITLDAAILPGDGDAGEVDESMTATEPDVTGVLSPVSSIGDNIIVKLTQALHTGMSAADSGLVAPGTSMDQSRHRTAVVDELPTPTSATSAPMQQPLQPAADESIRSKSDAQPSRRRFAPQRYGYSNTPALSPADDQDSEGEDSEHGETLRKRRKISKASKTSADQSQLREKAEASTKRGRPKKTKGAQSVAAFNTPTKVVTLNVKSKALASFPQTPRASATKSTRQVTPKQGKKQAQRASPKTPATLGPSELPPTPESVAVELVRPEPAVDQQKLALSRRLTAREPLGSKPPPRGQPLVWADSRQALCETLPYFKRPQGGCYQNDGHVYGFLFDGVGHCREYLDEDIIICRAGGSMEQDPSGGMVQKKDQSMKEAQVLAIMNDIGHQNPLIVICGNRNGGAQCEMPHQYSVLGWYKPVAVWEEKTAGRSKKIWTTIKYRLERMNQAGEPVPWHAPPDSDMSTLWASREPALSQQCNDCAQRFDQVYLQGWMCLNSSCDQFWMLEGFEAPCGAVGLDYNPDFLLSRAPAWGDESIPPAPLRPPIPDVGNIIGDDLAYINTRGICCPRCGRCNSRRLFDRWVCEKPSCNYELRPQHRPVMPIHLHTPWDVAPTLVRNRIEAGVHLKVEHMYGYKVCTYSFDGIDGCFIHAAATKSILSAPNGPDEMMANLQSEDLGLERRVFAVTKMSGGRNIEDSKRITATFEALPSPPLDFPAPDAEDGELAKDKRTFEEGDLMTAFSMNYGIPYKFVASGASRSFESAPKAVNDCRYRLNWAARTLLGKPKEVLDFNEELIFTYLEGQKIEYHDDGEYGLGPEIASLSLGGRAKMHVRMKAKHFVGCSKTGIFTEEKPVPGGIDGLEMYQKRLGAWEGLQQIKTDAAAYNKRRRELPRELDMFEKRMKKADDLVTVTLSHGDIMIMDGYDIQRYLEHKVVPEGYLRFALTCRTVLEDHLKPDERPEYVVQPDEGVFDGSIRS